MWKFIKKLIAPVIITILIVLYFILYISIGALVEEIPQVFKIVLIGVPLAFIILAIYMLYERIQEIRGGEEDDLSKY